MSKTKELIIMILSVTVLFFAIATNVFATDDVQDLNSLLGNSNNANANVNNDYNEIGNVNNNAVNNNVVNNDALNNINNSENVNNVNDNVNNNVNNNSGMPYTGVNSSAIVFIVICGISAIYAYKKIRDYNV